MIDYDEKMENELKEKLTAGQKELDELYRQLGIIYYESLSTGSSEKKHLKIAEINACHRSLLEYRKQLKHLAEMKNRRLCPSCNQAVPVQAENCPHCRIKLDWCSQCTYPVPDTYHFCVRCGHQLHQENLSGLTRRQCPGCRALVSGNANYCSECGVRMTDDTTQSSECVSE